MFVSRSLLLPSEVLIGYPGAVPTPPSGGTPPPPTPQIRITAVDGPLLLSDLHSSGPCLELSSFNSLKSSCKHPSLPSNTLSPIGTTFSFVYSFSSMLLSSLFPHTGPPPFTSVLSSATLSSLHDSSILPNHQCKHRT